MSNQPRIGILCSGGDAPGMNAAVSEAASCARSIGLRPVGIPGGLVGLCAGRSDPLNPVQVEEWSRRGGSALGASRLPTGMSRDQLLAGALNGCQLLRLNGLLVLGGNGSLSALALLAPAIPGAGVPATIDNDLAEAALSIGFDTARQAGVAALDAIRDTAGSLPGRVFTLQTLGGDTGILALAVAHAGFAHAVLTPEIPESQDRIVQQVQSSLRSREQCILVVAEGSEWSGRIESMLEETVGVRVRPSVLGHAQRGGPPSGADRELARVTVRAAVKLLSQRESGAVIWTGAGVAARDLAAAATRKPLDRELYASVWNS
jgi:6-phosphofructokinase 1